jgi:Ca-activated chloride channel family protein
VDTREDHVPRFLWLLVPALLLLAYDSWRLVRPRAIHGTLRTPQDSSAVAVLLLAIVPSVFGGCAQGPDPAALFKQGKVADAVAAYRARVAGGDTSARTLYNLGSAVLGADSLKEATTLLEAVRRNSDGEVRARARFNAGLAALRMGRTPQNPDADVQLAAARDAYRAFLRERPGHADAKWNYELALRQPPPQSGGGGGGGNSRNSDQQSQPQSPGGLDQRQAEALLNSAAREEKDVQGRKQRVGRTPPGGKDW